MPLPVIGCDGLALIIILRFLLLIWSCGWVRASEADDFAKRPEFAASACRETEVVILGAGVAGITAGVSSSDATLESRGCCFQASLIAWLYSLRFNRLTHYAALQQVLANRSIGDFVIVEHNAQIGGRVAHTTFGAKGKTFTVELGANWVQGLGSPGGPENPIWTLAKKYNVTNTYSNYSDILTYDETGAVDYTKLLNDFDDAYATLEQDAGYILSRNLQDRSTRAGLNLAAWKPTTDMRKQAVDWWQWDWEYAYPPEESSQEFGIVNYNTTFYQYSDANNYVFDQRGFNTFIKGEASTFLTRDDPRLLLNTTVTNITYNPSSVTVQTHNGTCIKASYAICTFSLGVLQNDAVVFDPPLPSWKREAIDTFQMGTYTKIFLQFPYVFWPRETQFFLYADPSTRGYYPVWQSLDAPGFLPGSGIIFVTVVDQQSYRAERMTDAAVQAEAMDVLYSMFGRDTVPDPIAFMFPRWSSTPWAYGSYSNWPPGMTLELHQNLRANLGRLWFAGEATSAEYFGFLHGAYYEGQAASATLASCVSNRSGSAECGQEKRYATLHGSTSLGEYGMQNGWQVSSFQTIGDV
ncbi:MAG: hypothetical protein M1821_002080 [Bathelium mastoideum]|nr:MAG: hypothetical protein M1821_002080 [Bathelium mastoideum]